MIKSVDERLEKVASQWEQFAKWNWQEMEPEEPLRPRRTAVARERLKGI